MNAAPLFYSYNIKHLVYMIKLVKLLVNTNIFLGVEITWEYGPHISTYGCGLQVITI